jgi:hypothetical protein
LARSGFLAAVLGLAQQQFPPQFVPHAQPHVAAEASPAEAVDPPKTKLSPATVAATIAMRLSRRASGGIANQLNIRLVLEAD